MLSKLLLEPDSSARVQWALYFLRRILSCLGQASDGIHYQGLNGTEIATSHKGKKAKVAADPHITDKPIHWRPALREYSVFNFPSPN